MRRHQIRASQMLENGKLLSKVWFQFKALAPAPGCCLDPSDLSWSCSLMGEVIAVRKAVMIAAASTV
ncbi:hypothetical protein IGI04_008322 [Brassica rapa subsp. trilocularis]|uniref:Uncharacterized protein n=1 Tax=Brassica rapa subsp. trilocularis TaxID=1813537 RepID=A0ABQ7NMK3_BRACM|nr:hypothetical protein IGI04_008322 [Brassica rapa subsp. trilocularis]